MQAISATSSSFSLTIGSLPEGVGERKEIWSEVWREVGHRKRYEKAVKKEEAIDHKN